MKTYYIYHIPNVKIGCSTRPKQRVSQQGYTEYEILEEHTCIETASEREIELQKEYGYKVDTCSYIDSIKNNAHKQHIAGRVSATKQWKKNREEQLKKSKKGGKRAVELGVGVHGLSHEDYVKAGTKGFANGLGKLPMEKRLEFVKRANKARMKNRKFSKEDVQWIRKVFIPRHPEYGVVPLSKKFGIKEHAMRNIIKYRSYKDY